MSIAGDHFYDSTAFGTLAAIVVGMFTIAATVWVTLRVANPKRRLYYWLSSDTPLITNRQDLSEELKVTYGVHELKSPRVVNVLVVSRGRRDISPEAFNGKPVCFELGTHIVECIKVTTSPSDRSDPAWTVEDSKLLIGPDLFGMRQETVFSLLIDGDPPRIVPPKQSMLDVRIERGDGAAGFSLFALTVLALVIALTILGLTVGQFVGGSEGALIGVVPGALAAVLAGYVPAIVDSARRRREELEGQAR